MCGTALFHLRNNECAVGGTIHCNAKATFTNFGQFYVEYTAGWDHRVGHVELDFQLNPIGAWGMVGAGREVIA